MAVKGQVNWQGQQRVDVPHARLIESFLCGDFDSLAGTVLSGGAPLIVAGFSIDPSGIGGQAKNLTVTVASSAALHQGASESGTVFSVIPGTAPEQLSTTNANVAGSFSANADNFVGLDLIRSVDDSSQDSVQFLDAASNLEAAKSIPLTRAMKYRFVISTRSFASSPNVAPIAIVHVNASGFVTSITDARRMMFRLGSGGDVPNPLAPYNFGLRVETAGSSTSAAVNPFIGGDKSISSLKTWMDATMTRVWEIAGGEHWYSPTAEHDVTMLRTGAGYTTGDNFAWDGTNLTWQGIKFLFANSTATSNTVQDQLVGSVGLTDLAPGECVYVDLNRATDGSVLVPVKAQLSQLGTGAVPGSRYMFAWRPSTGGVPFARGGLFTVGTMVPAASTVTLGGVKLASAFGGTASAPEVPTMDASSSSGTLANVLGGGLTRGATTAGNINIGTGANDNTVTISRAGQTTDIAGALAVTGNTTFGGTLDAATAATLNIGGSNAISVTINKPLFVNSLTALTGNAATLKGNLASGAAGVDVVTTTSVARAATDLIFAAQNAGTNEVTVSGNGNLHANGTVDAGVGFSVGGSAVSLFPAAYGTCRYLFAGPGGQTSTVTAGPPPSWLDLSTFGAFGFHTDAVNASVNTSDGSITVTNAGTYLVSHSVGIGDPLAADGVAIMVSTRVLQNGVDVMLGANAFSLNTGGGSWHFGICSGSGVFVATAGTVFKVQVTNGAAAATGNIMVNSVAFTVTRIA